MCNDRQLRFHPLEITVVPQRPTPEEEPVPEDWTPRGFVGKGRSDKGLQ